MVALLICKALHMLNVLFALSLYSTQACLIFVKT